MLWQEPFYQLPSPEEIETAVRKPAGGIRLCLLRQSAMEVEARNPTRCPQAQPCPEASINHSREKASRKIIVRKSCEFREYVCAEVPG